MPGYVRRGTDWWFESPEGTWSRWDPPSGTWQPGTPPPAGPGEEPEPGWPPYRSLALLGKWVAGLLVVAASVDVVAIVSDISEYRLLTRVIEGELVTLAEAEANDLRQAIIGIAQFLLLLGTGIPFIVWTHRAYSNLRSLGAEELRFRRWWAIGGWFIPVMSAFRPKQIVNDVWRGSDPDLPSEMRGIWRGRPVPAWWIVWWLLFLFGSEVAYLALRQFLAAETPEEIRQGTFAYLISDSMTAVAGILGFLMVRAITLRQVARAERLGVEPRSS